MTSPRLRLADILESIDEVAANLPTSKSECLNNKLLHLSKIET